MKARTVIVCSCQSISDRDIHAAIDWMRAADAQAIITPGKIYRALGKTPDCGGCMKLFVQKMRQNDNLEVPVELLGLKPRSNASRSDRHARRQESH